MDDEDGTPVKCLNCGHDGVHDDFTDHHIEGVVYHCPECGSANCAADDGED